MAEIAKHQSPTYDQAEQAAENYWAEPVPPAPGGETLSVTVSGDDQISADDVDRLVYGGFRPYRITLHGGATAPRAYIHTIWSDRIECGTRDGTIHATYPLASIRSISRA
jgi:hypothetical protein